MDKKNKFMEIYGKVPEENRELFIETIIEEIYNNYEFDQKQCPICKKKFDLFLPNNQVKRILCPECGSIPRHRFVYSFLYKKFKNTKSKLKFLAFSPESLDYKFKDLKNIEYVCADYNNISVDNIPYEDNYFDVIYDFYNVSRSIDDILSLKELYRVIKPVSEGGFIILYNYVGNNLKTTEVIKDKNIIRNYGSDFFSKLEEIGFNVEKISPLTLFNDEETIKKYGLVSTDAFYVCTKVKSLKTAHKIPKRLSTKKR